MLFDNQPYKQMLCVSPSWLRGIHSKEFLPGVILLCVPYCARCVFVCGVGRAGGGSVGGGELGKAISQSFSKKLMSVQSSFDCLIFWHICLLEEHKLQNWRISYMWHTLWYEKLLKWCHWVLLVLFKGRTEVIWASLYRKHPKMSSVRAVIFHWAYLWFPGAICAILSPSTSKVF